MLRPHPVTSDLAATPRLAALVQRAHARAARERAARERAARIAIVYPCDALALNAAAALAGSGVAQPVLVGPIRAIESAADGAGIDVRDYEIVPTAEDPRDASSRACVLARDGNVSVLMKGSLHSDELLSAVVSRTSGLRGDTRISHTFVLDLPCFAKLIAMTDCVVNILPTLEAKQDILTNAVHLLLRLGVTAPKVAIVAATEVVNAAIPATVHAQAIVALQHKHAPWPGAIVEGPYGLDNAISIEAARIKGLGDSRVAGDPDLLLMPDLSAGNMVYKSFVHVGGGDCAGVVLGARVPIVLTSRADSLRSRLASAALALLARP